MRHLTLLLLLTTLASALPLRQGASLGYRVWRGWENDTCFVTIAVGDSVATDSGVLWNVAIRDSLIGGDRIRNSQAVLRVAHGDTVWQTPSCLAAWDPASRKVDSVSWMAGNDSAKYDYPYPYGALGVACRIRTPDNTEPGQSRYGEKLLAYSLRDSMRVWTSGGVTPSMPLPHVETQSDTGMVRLQEKALDERWYLTSLDGKDFGPKYDWPQLGTLIVGFDPGKTWVWRDSGRRATSEGRSGSFSVDFIDTHVLRILSTQADSGEWKRCTIQWNTSDSSLGVRVVGGTSTQELSVKTTTDTLQIRLNQHAGVVSIGEGSLQQQLVAQGLFRLTTDRTRIDGGFDRTFKDSGSSLVLTWHTSHSMTLMTNLGAVSIGYSDDKAPTVYGSIPTSTLSGVMRLLSMDSLVLSNGEYRLGISSRREGPAPSRWLASVMDLEQELSIRPGAAVRLTSVSGRSDIHSGPEALRALRSRHGIVMLELRDGNVSIPGRMLLP